MRESVHILAAAVTAAMLGGCAAGEPTRPLLSLDMAEVRQALDCPLDTSPVCTERMGKPYHCFCADRDALERILEPDKY